MIIISIQDVMDSDFSTRAILRANQIESKLKYNTRPYVTVSSQKIIVSVLKRFSSPITPINNIGTVMTLLSNGKYQNVAISTLICHLFYLRIFRYNFRLIKKRHHKLSDLLGLLLVGGKLTDDLIDVAIDAYFARNHRKFIDTMFEIKARASFSEQLNLQQIQWRYWKNHHARLNDHQIYKFWW